MNCVDSLSKGGNMREEYITMSTKEVGRLEVIQKVVDKRLKQRHAAKILGLSTRA